MRVVVALGGNALLRRGQVLSAENQRENARTACAALAPLDLGRIESRARVDSELRGDVLRRNAVPSQLSHASCQASRP